MNKAYLRLIYFGLALVILSACNSGGTPQDPQAGDLVPPTTKVMDEAAKTSLKSLTDTTLAFAGAPQNLAVGDVIVTGPTAAAPYGLLRKVKALDDGYDPDEGGEYTLTTEPAKLVDAIHQGSLRIKQELTPKGVKTARALQEGITTQALDITINTDFGSGDKVKAIGSVSITPILELDLDISCNNRTLGICSEIPDLNFRTRVGIEERGDLRLTASAAYTFDEEIPLVTYEFDPLTFSIAGVPIVFVPELTLYLRADGSISATLDTQVTQNATLAVGFQYNSDTGFRDLSEQTVSYVRNGPTFTGQAETRAVIGVRFALLLYGVVGPYGSLELGPHAQVNVSGFGNAQLLWKLEGCLYLNVGVRIDIFTYEKNYEKELYRACELIAEQANRAPIVTIESPNANTQVYRNVVTPLTVSVIEPDGNPVTCVWSSNRSEDVFIATSSGCNASITFSTTGNRTLTLTATDPAGATGSASVSINVQETPQVLVQITNPSDGSNLGLADEITLTGSVTGTLASDFTWKVATLKTLGRITEIDKLYTIGKGATLAWTPSSTFPPANPCEDAYFPVWIILEVSDGTQVGGSRFVQVRLQRFC